MLGIAGLPFVLSQWLDHINVGFGATMALYVLLLLFLGTIIDTGSIILVCVPLFLHAIENMGLSLVWFGLITVVGAEIGLLTPPFGLSCFVIKTAVDRNDISLNDIFFGAVSVRRRDAAGADRADRVSAALACCCCKSKTAGNGRPRIEFALCDSARLARRPAGIHAPAPGGLPQAQQPLRRGLGLGAARRRAGAVFEIGDARHQPACGRTAGRRC